ncbi:putative pheromone receptor [Armillaria nabsnona]|nr:putative pheromone receptor [Armillaria nabsnona]
MHREFAPVAFLAALSLVLPLPWHWRVGNVATLSIICWLFIMNVIYGVDALVWANNVDIVVPVWCDITTKLIIGANVALPAACLCICIHLEQVASVRNAQTTIADKKRRRIFEVGMCWGLPLIFMALHYVVQGHRFDIIEEYGCRPTTYFSIPAIFIVWIPPILLSIACLVFAGLALRHFMIRRMTFAAHLNSSKSALTISRYFRLMLMSIMQMIWSSAVTCYTLWFTTIGIPIRTWDNWRHVHSDFLRVDQYPAILLPPLVAKAYYFLWWLVPASTIIFVAFFAFGREAVEDYKKWYLWFCRNVLRQTPKTETKKTSFGSWARSSDKNGAISLPSIAPSSPRSNIANTSTTSIQTPTPPSPYKYRSSLDDLDYDDGQSDDTTCYGTDPQKSLPPTPSTATAFESPSSIVVQLPLPPMPIPLPPPPRHPRRQGSERPFTYPSSDASHQDINMNTTDRSS